MQTGIKSFTKWFSKAKGTAWFLFTISSNVFFLMPWFSNAFMCLSNVQGSKGTASSGQPCPAPGLPHPAHSPGPQCQQPLPQWPHSSRAGLQPPQPCSAWPWAHILAQPLPAQGWGCPIPPSRLPCSWLGQWDSPGMAHPAWMCSVEPLLGQQPAPELPCSVLHGLVAVIQHSTGKVTWRVPSEI